MTKGVLPQLKMQPLSELPLDSDAIQASIEGHFMATSHRRSSSSSVPLRVVRGPEDFVEECYSADSETLEMLDYVLKPGMLSDIRLTVNNISINGQPTGDCAVLILNDGTGLSITPEFLMLLLNHPRFRRNPAPIGVFADVRQEPAITFEMLIADHREPEFELLVDTNDCDLDFA